MSWKKSKTNNSLNGKIDTLVASGVIIRGNIRYFGGIQIDGQVVGNVEADEAGALLRITRKGQIIGEVRGPNLIVNGRIEGNIYCSGHIVLAEHAIVTGNIHYHLLEMLPGSIINGTLIHAKAAAEKDDKKKPEVLHKKKQVSTVAAKEVVAQHKFEPDGKPPRIKDSYLEPLYLRSDFSDPKHLGNPSIP